MPTAPHNLHTLHTPHTPHTPREARPPASPGPVRHCIVPFAGTHDDTAQAALGAQGTLELPYLRQLLARMQPLPASAATPQDPTHDPTYDPAYTLSPPHEVALARALGWTTPAGDPLPDGQLPWAAHEAGRAGVPCAWFIPCQYRVGMEEVSLVPPQDLQVDEAASRRLFDALRPFCEEDGLRMTWVHPHRWLAEGAPLAGFASASLDRVAHRRIEAWLPDPRRWPALVRLQNEAQMLFYTHPLHDERSGAGLPAVNGFWVAGSGVWQGPAGTSAATAPTIDKVDALRPPALHGNWAAWTEAWQELDATQVKAWLEKLQELDQASTAVAASGPAPHFQLTLCGERTSRSWVCKPGQGPRQSTDTTQSLWQRWRRSAGQWLGASPPSQDLSGAALRECLRSL